MESGNKQTPLQHLLAIKWISLLAASAMLLGIVAFLAFHITNASAASPEKASEVAFHGVAEADYQNKFTQISNSGYQPMWVNAFNVGDQAYFNALFHPADGTPWVARHGMTSENYQSQFNFWVIQQKYRLTLVDSYLSHGQIRYAAIFKKIAGPDWIAHHGMKESDFVQDFNTLNKNGYVAVNISAVSLNGVRSYTTLYQKKDVGDWQSFVDMTPASYQAKSDANVAAGRHLAYLSTYTDASGPHFNAIWYHDAPDGLARHGLSGSDYQTYYDKETVQGFSTRAVAGYEANGQAYYAAFWTK